MVVTGLLKVDNKRTKVTFDDESSFVLYNSEVRKYGISEELEIDSDTVEQIGKLLTNRARNRVLYMLGNSDKSSGDIARKLVDSGYPENIVRDVIGQLESYGYIDDERYVRNYIESVSGRKSRREILDYLRNHNINVRTIERVMGELYVDEHDAVKRLVAKKGYSMEEFASLGYDERNKIIQYLLRKGFSMETIRCNYSYN
jgi:regulatory protein